MGSDVTAVAVTISGSLSLAVSGTAVAVGTLFSALSASVLVATTVAVGTSMSSSVGVGTTVVTVGTVAGPESAHPDNKNVNIKNR
jgi:hypothetical protein